MPFVLRELCEHVGVSLEDYLPLRPVEPTCRYHWSDGTIFDAYSDPGRLGGELERVFPAERAAVETFLRDAATLYEATADVFLFQRFDGFREFFKPRNLRLLPALPRLNVSQTVERSLRGRFTSEKLVQLFARFATYNGSSPYRAPATLNVIPHVELGFGAWYPQGGMYAVAEMLRNLACARGVEIKTGTRVEAVRRTRRRIDAIVADADVYPVDAVVSNVDVLWTYRHLLAPAGVAVPAAVARAERSCSGYLLLAAVRGRHPELAHHNIFFSDDYPGEFRDIFERGRLPRAMTIYVSISAKSDPRLAPPGCENWYILMNAPAGGTEHRDLQAQQAYAASVWDRLRAFGMDPEVQWQSRLTPLDIEQRDNSVGGAIYGASSNSAFSAFLRPTNKAPRLENFYFVGGSTHPGGGVPLVMLSGKITAEMILEERRPSK
jgi:phytoene desaturase